MSVAPPGASHDEVAIVGSGPAAIACAWQLVARGLRPVLLDAGEGPPPATVSLVQRLRDTEGAWTPDLLAEATASPPARGPLPKKLVFGSDFLHGRDRAHSPLLNESFVDPTFARGGYTVAWGGAMLPARAQDLRDWPLAPGELDAGFAQALSRLPLAGADDGLSAVFPLYGATPAPLPIGPQAQQLLQHLHSSGACVAGQARLAVSAAGCRLCGLCLTGCPFGVIHTLDTAVSALAARGAIRYQPGTVVTSMHDDGDGVRVNAVDLAGRALPAQRFARVFLAAGAIGSARIALESAGAFDAPLPMLDSQKFAVPVWVPARSGQEDGHALPHLFLDALDGDPAHWVHLQLSPFGEYAHKAMAEKLRFGPLQLDALAASVTRHLMVGWGGLHSSLSGGFQLTLLRAHRHGRPVLKIVPQPAQGGREHVRRAMRVLNRHLAPAGARLLSPAAVVGPPGAGFHFGGSLPMREQPKAPFDTDRQGRLAQWRNVHVVDSSVFPSIPATTMVLTLMANAWRIAGEAAL